MHDLITCMFPKSNPQAIFQEVVGEHELSISTWLGYGQHIRQELFNTSKLAISVFEDLFECPTGAVLVMVNHWDMQEDIYMLNQLEAYRVGDFKSETFVDETQEVEKVQIHFQSRVEDIDYKKIMSKFIERDYDSSNKINSRIFFIHPTKQIYLLYFDSEIIVGSNDLNQLTPYFEKYQRHIETARRKRFLEQLKC